jgi:hypothetical protein
MPADEKPSNRAKQWTAVVLAGAIAVLTGCGSKAGESKAADKIVAGQLQRSFGKVEGATRDQINQAAQATIAKDYARAIGIMNEVIRRQRILDAAQKQALDNLLAHTRQAVARAPGINNSQLYQATSDLQLLLHPME